MVNNAINLGMSSGVYGPAKVLSDEVVTECDSRKADELLTACALANIASYGKPVPSPVLYGGGGAGHKEEQQIGKVNETLG